MFSRWQQGQQTVAWVSDIIDALWMVPGMFQVVLISHCKAFLSCVIMNHVSL